MLIGTALRLAGKKEPTQIYARKTQETPGTLCSSRGAPYGGEKGIRTLDTFIGYTRFPIVRLRPAQPSLHRFALVTARHILADFPCLSRSFFKFLTCWNGKQTENRARAEIPRNFCLKFPPRRVSASYNQRNV